MTKKKKQNDERLKLWQGRLATAEAAYSPQLSEMDAREKLYVGDPQLKNIVPYDHAKETKVVRNLVSEIVEAQVSSTIPQPKVTARKKENEPKAKLIEDMLRNELDRMQFEQINDQMERTVPIQGGGLLLVEWDNSRRTHTTTGEVNVRVLHPKQVIPQAGVTDSVEQMDYIFLKLPQTKGSIRRRYGVDVSDEGESESDIRSAGESDTAEDMVTQYVAYYRNDQGGIGLYSWVGDTELEDLEDYQARRLRKCRQCGAVEPSADVEAMEEPTLDGSWPGHGSATVTDPLALELGEAEKPEAPKKGAGRKVCPYCGGTQWEEQDEDIEELTEDIRLSDGSVIPGAKLGWQEGVNPETGLPELLPVMETTKIPFYKPNAFPIILQKNVSRFGRFLGDSDVDKIADQQNAVNRLETKIMEKLLTSGSYITLPDDAYIDRDTREMKIIRPGSPQNMSLIKVYDMEGNIQQDVTMVERTYQDARNIIGITDSFQGRTDTTAQSGKAKEFAAAQSAGRLESKRVMKDAAYANLFELIFKFKLAYADEPRPVVAKDKLGGTVYEEFNRYDFLAQDAAGAWYWDDQYLFSTDTTAPLASNREAMWQETRANFQSGAFGDPTNLETLISFWGKMELLHYPGASETKAQLEERLRQQQEREQQQMQLAQQLQGTVQQQNEAQAQQSAVQQTIAAAQQQAAADAERG